MDVFEIEKILNRVSLHLYETDDDLGFNFPSVNEVKRAFANPDSNWSQLILQKFKIINNIYECIPN